MSCTVGVAQRLEHQAVDLGAGGSSPLTHPILRNMTDIEDRKITVTTKTKDNKALYKDVPEPGRDWNISAKELGNALNETKIKVIHCQLGCFD